MCLVASCDKLFPSHLKKKQFIGHLFHSNCEKIITWNLYFQFITTDAIRHVIASRAIHVIHNQVYLDTSTKIDNYQTNQIKCI